MATDNASLSKNIAQNNQSSLASKMTPAAFEKTILQWFQTNGRRMVTFAGSEADARRMMAGLFYLASKNPKIMTCTTTSIADCLMQSAMARLFPGSGSECTYLTFWNKNIHSHEAQFVPMFGGILKHAYNNPIVKSVNCDIVYEKDEFSYQKGTDAYLTHKPFEGPDEERGEAVKVYFVGEVRGGGKIIEVKNMQWIEKIRSKSAAGESEYGPWSTFFEDMCKKSILKYGCKYIPRSRELDLAIQVDNSIERPDLTSETKVPFSGDISGLAAQSGIDLPSTEPPAAIPAPVAPETIDLINGDGEKQKIPVSPDGTEEDPNLRGFLDLANREK